MKYYFAMFLFTYTFAYGQVKVSDELKVKADKIRDELLNGKSLPLKIEHVVMKDSGPHTTNNDYFYNTTRTDNKIVDSVLIQISMRDDTLNRLLFVEVYNKKGIDWVKYCYAINQNGIIDWAYRTEAPKADPKVIQQNGSTTYIPDNQPIIEISSNPEYLTNKKTDDKQIEVYKERLKVTVDELYNILFKK